MTDKRKQLLEMLERALANSLGLPEATDFIASLDSEQDNTVALAAHALIHFVTDSDLRRRDSEYDQLMRAKLREYARVFRHSH
jgi:hypothetical protein